MSIQALKEQIREFGVANAIVVLNPETVAMLNAVNSKKDTKDLEQVTSKANQVLSELSRNFYSGKIAQREAIFAAVQAAVKPGSAVHRLKKNVPPMAKRSPMLHFPRLGIVYGALDNMGAEALEKHAAVSDINHAPQLSLIQPEKTEETLEGSHAGEFTWGLKRMKASEMWEKGYTGTGIVVAHLDTGADSQHPALQQAIAHKRFFDLDGTSVEVPGEYEDTGDHGTHTAATIAGRDDSDGPIIGMAPGASLACGTVITGGDTVARVLAGMEWALEIGARILNMSLGFRGWNGSFEPIMQTLRAQQLLPIIAIGNEGPQTSRSPGNYGTALSVGASDENDQVWPLSSSQHGGNTTGPLVCAPGVGVLSAVPGGNFKTQSGTSMATPHVAGLAALLLHARPTASIDQVQLAILESCENPAQVDGDRIGAGIPNSITALNILSSL